MFRLDCLLPHVPSLLPNDWVEALLSSALFILPIIGVLFIRSQESPTCPCSHGQSLINDGREAHQLDFAFWIAESLHFEFQLLYTFLPARRLRTSTR
jgi:hypothetical protein